MSEPPPRPLEEDGDAPREPPLPDPQPGPEGVPKDDDPGPDA
jgi:hypothetical protein